MRTERSEEPDFQLENDKRDRQVSQPARDRVNSVRSDEKIAQRRFAACACRWCRRGCRRRRSQLGVVRRQWRVRLRGRRRQRFVIHHRPEHGKTLGPALWGHMLRRFLHSDAFRAPQFAAAALLLLYLLQCVWLLRVQTLHASTPDSDQALRIYQGLAQWKGCAIAGAPASLRSKAATGLPSAGRAGHLRVREGYDQDRSPLYYLVAAAPLLLRLGSWFPPSLQPLLAASPNLFFGVMLGGSLWYVARRLYGNAGGYIALALYCFSPATIVNAAGTHTLGEMGAAWGAFGTVFTAIAVAHTLYAPREVVLWNWRRIVLLGVALAIAVGSQFSLIVLVPLTLGFLLYVAPVRRQSGFVIWVAACVLGFLLLFAVYFFHWDAFQESLRHAAFWGAT